MKKLLISIFALGYILNIAAANIVVDNMNGIDNRPSLKNPKNVIKQQPTLTRADEAGDNMFGYCFDIYSAYGFGANFIGAVLEGVIEIPKELAQDWKGAKVTGINVGYGQSSNKNVNVYITKDLQGYPERMQEAVMENELDWNLVTLDEPYVIDGDGFYIGYQTVLNAADDYPLAVDGILSTLGYGDIVGLTTTGSDQIYEGVGEFFGSICLRAQIEGGNMPQYGVMLDTMYMNTLTGLNQPFDAIVSLVNTGTSTITDVQVSCKVGGKEINDVKVSVYGDLNSEELTEIVFGRPGFLLLEGLSSSASGNQPVEVTLTGVTTPEGTGQLNGAITSEIFVTETTFDKNVVVEEFTGTWCGNCPRGIVGMAYMEENYGDKGFIGIAVHYNDPMEVNSYWDVTQYYSGGQFPSAVMDRNSYFDPAVETLEEYYNQAINNPAEAKVSIKAEYDELSNVVNATATAEYGFTGSDVTYALAFVVTENQVGPYVQTNYFSGASFDVGGWQDMGPNVPWMFDHVARNIWFAFGIEDSQPTTVELGKEYPFSIQLPMENVSNVNECEVIAMLLNYTTGEIINGAKVSLAGDAGVDSILAEPLDGVYKVYNPQGIKVLETKNASEIDNLAKGIYIINGKKALVK